MTVAVRILKHPCSIGIEGYFLAMPHCHTLPKDKALIMPNLGTIFEWFSPLGFGRMSLVGVAIEH